MYQEYNRSANTHPDWNRRRGRKLLHGCNRLRRRTRAVLEAFAVIDVRDPPGAVVDLSSLTIVPSTIRIVRPRSSSGYAPFSRSNSIQQGTQPSPAIAQAFEQGDIRNVGPFRQVCTHNGLPQRVNPAPRAALAYATASQAMESHVIVRPHRTAKPFAAILRETTMRALASFLQRYAFTKHRCTNITTCSLSSLVGRLLS